MSTEFTQVQYIVRAGFHFGFAIIVQDSASKMIATSATSKSELNKEFLLDLKTASEQGFGTSGVASRWDELMTKG